MQQEYTGSITIENWRNMLAQRGIHADGTPIEAAA